MQGKKIGNWESTLKWNIYISTEVDNEFIFFLSLMQKNEHEPCALKL